MQWGDILPYAVNYGSNDLDKYPEQKASGIRKKRYLITMLLLLTAVLLVFRFKTQVVNWLIPGDDQVTLQHTEDLLSNLREGVPIGDALTAFCEDIVANER